MLTSIVILYVLVITMAIFCLGLMSEIKDTNELVKATGKMLDMILLAMTEHPKTKEKANDPQSN